MSKIIDIAYDMLWAFMVVVAFINIMGIQAPTAGLRVVTSILFGG